MVVIVCYDVSDDRRRTRLYKTLEGFGQAVQRSVFECDLSPQEYQRLKQRVQRLLRPAEDRLRFYVMCEGCVRRIESLGGPAVERRPGYYVV